MNRYKKLINNSLVFTIGSFGSKLINFLMVPLYTNLLSTAEYGTVDLILTTINLLIPITTLELGQAALRFAIDAKTEIEKNKIFSLIFTHGVCISLLIVAISPLLIQLGIFNNSILFLLLLLLSIFNNMFSQYIRGIGMIKEFAINGIIMTVVTVSSNIVLLVVFNLKIEGYTLSLILSYLVSNIYLLINVRGFTKLTRFSIDRPLLRAMLKFSVPIIPNSAMWWLINGSTRYFILYFVGATGNGLYAVANKIPSIISMITGIFSQAWQLSSFEEYNSNDKNRFYSNIFNVYSALLFIISSIIIIVLKPLMLVLVDSSFYNSWQIVPMLLFAVIYQSFATFLGTNYTAAKETKGTFSTSIFAGVISLISSFILVPIIGAIGASISTALSFFGMFIIRLIDTKKYVNIDFNIRIFCSNNIILLLQIITLFLFNGVLLVIVELSLFILLTIINKGVITRIIGILLDGYNEFKERF